MKITISFKIINTILDEIFLKFTNAKYVSSFVILVKISVLCLLSGEKYIRWIKTGERDMGMAV
jgi:hypothetical protein